MSNVHRLPSRAVHSLRRVSSWPVARSSSGGTPGPTCSGSASDVISKRCPSLCSRHSISSAVSYTSVLSSDGPHPGSSATDQSEARICTASFNACPPESQKKLSLLTRRLFSLSSEAGSVSHPLPPPLSRAGGPLTRSEQLPLVDLNVKKQLGRRGEKWGNPFRVALLPTPTTP